MDQMEKARDVFRHLTELRPGVALYETWKGHAERALGAVDNARSAYEEAIRLDSSFAEPLTELANLNLDSGSPDRAETLVSRALTLSPEDPRTQFVAGLVWSRLQRWNDVVRILQTIKPDELEYPQSQYLLSRAYRQLGDAAGADAALERFRKSNSPGAVSTAGRKRFQ
jgi:predicted Zn-dependent protease